MSLECSYVISFLIHVLCVCVCTYSDAFVIESTTNFATE